PQPGHHPISAMHPAFTETIEGCREPRHPQRGGAIFVLFLMYSFRGRGITARSARHYTILCFQLGVGSRLVVLPTDLAISVFLGHLADLHTRSPKNRCRAVG